jgi:hypothetical protein
LNLINAKPEMNGKTEPFINVANSLSGCELMNLTIHQTQIKVRMTAKKVIIDVHK